MPTQLGKLFEQDDLKLAVEMTAALAADVGDGAFELPSLDRASETATLTLFDQPFRANGTFEAKLGLLGSAATIDPFGTGQRCDLRPGFNTVALEVDTAFGINGEAAPSTGAMTLSATAAASGSLVYRHWLSSRNQTRFNALSQAVARSRPPQLVGLAQGDDGFPQIGEVHRLDGKLSLDLGLDFQFGRSLQDELALELFGGLSTPLRVAGEATVKAALGLSVLSEMQLTVGRACQIHDGWTRIRLQRRNERRLSFGAGVALKLHYDLGSGLTAILEETLGQVQMPPLVDSLRELNGLLAAGDWDQVRQRLSDTAADRVTELLDDAGWRDWLANDPRVARLTALSQRIVGAYDGLDARIRSWWDRVLGEADLGPGSPTRRLLERVAAIDPQRPVDGLLDDLLTGDAKELVDWIEVFTGSSLEDLLLGSDQKVRGTLGRAVTLAQQGLAFLDDLAPDTVRTVQGFLDRTGVVRLVDFLRRNTLSKDTIEQQLTGRVKGAVERLVGKSWDRITEADLARVRAWAERVQKILDAPAELEAKLRENLAKLKLDYGLSLSLEIERVSRTTALLDLEIDPAQAHAKLQGMLAKALRVGDARRMLQVLAEESADDKYDQQPLPFQLRECVFTSERLRTTAFSALLNILGLGRKFAESLGGTSQRIEQCTLRVQQTGNAFRRTADYAAAFERGESENKASSIAAVWIDCRDQGAGLDLDAVYDLDAPETTLRLTYGREDDALSKSELDALDHVLRDLGFAGDHAVGAAPGAPAALGGPTRRPASELGVPLGSRTRFALEIRLPGATLATVAGGLETAAGERGWDNAFLNAAHRWLTDQSVQRLAIKPTKASVGPVLAEYIKRPLFLSHWRDGSFSLRRAIQDADPVIVTVSGGSVAIKATEQTGALPVWRQPFGLLEPIVKKRASGLAGLRDVGRKWEGAAGRTPAAYQHLLPAFASAWRRAWVYTVSWPNPMFGIWLVVARLTLADPALLAEAKGVAFLHWKGEAQDDWSQPWIWRLDGGIPNNLERGVFPFS